VAVCHHSLAFWSRRFFSLFQGFFTTRLSIRKVHPLKPETRNPFKTQAPIHQPHAPLQQSARLKRDARGAPLLSDFFFVYAP
jgi:hypothetical protein